MEVLRMRQKVLHVNRRQYSSHHFFWFLFFLLFFCCNVFVPLIILFTPWINFTKYNGKCSLFPFSFVCDTSAFSLPLLQSKYSSLLHPNAFLLPSHYFVKNEKQNFVLPSRHPRISKQAKVESNEKRLFCFPLRFTLLPKQKNCIFLKNVQNSKLYAKSSSPSFLPTADTNLNDDDSSSFITTSDFKLGECIEVKGKPFMIMNYQNVSLARGSASCRTKLKNLLDGGFIDMSFRPGEKVKHVSIEKKDVIFSYKDTADDVLVFQDTKTWEELRIKVKLVEESIPYLKDGIAASVKLWKGLVIDLNLPTTVEYRVINTSQHAPSQAGRRQVIVESGLQVVVPSYISVGDRVIVNTQNGTFVKKA